MTDFIIKPLPYDLSNQTSLALIGKYLTRINFNGLVAPAFSLRSGNSRNNSANPTYAGNGGCVIRRRLGFVGRLPVVRQQRIQVVSAPH